MNTDITRVPGLLILEMLKSEGKLEFLMVTIGIADSYFFHVLTHAQSLGSDPKILTNRWIVRISLKFWVRHLKSAHLF